MKTSVKPTWVTLYSICMIGVGLMFYVPLLHMASAFQTMALLLLAVAMFILIGLWIVANSAAIEAEERDMLLPLQWHFIETRPESAPADQGTQADNTRSQPQEL